MNFCIQHPCVFLSLSQKGLSTKRDLYGRADVHFLFLAIKNITDLYNNLYNIEVSLFADDVVVFLHLIWSSKYQGGGGFLMLKSFT